MFQHFPKAAQSREWSPSREQILHSNPSPPYLCIISHKVKLHVLHGVYIFPFHLRKRYKQIRAIETVNLASLQNLQGNRAGELAVSILAYFVFGH